MTHHHHSKIRSQTRANPQFNVKMTEINAERLPRSMQIVLAKCKLLITGRKLGWPVDNVSDG